METLFYSSNDYNDGTDNGCVVWVADVLLSYKADVKVLEILDEVLDNLDWVALGTLAIGLLTLSWSIRSRQSPVWSLGAASTYTERDQERRRAVRLKAFTALQKAGYQGFLRTHKDLQYFMLYCEGEMPASRVRFSITPGFAVGVTRFDDTGELATSVAIQTAHVVRVTPGTRFLITVAPPQGVSIKTGYLYVRWSRIPARFERDDVQALPLNLGKDYRLTRVAKREIRRTTAKVRDVFPE